MILVLSLLSLSIEFDGILTSDFLTTEFNTSLTFMDLSNRNITSIEDNAFENFNNLQLLNLQYNQIKGIKNEIFKGLTSLRNLILDNNNITTIDNNSFVDLDNLYWLN